MNTDNLAKDFRISLEIMMTDSDFDHNPSRRKASDILKSKTGKNKWVQSMKEYPKEKQEIKPFIRSISAPSNRSMATVSAGSMLDHFTEKANTLNKNRMCQWHRISADMDIFSSTLPLKPIPQRNKLNDDKSMVKETSEDQDVSLLSTPTESMLGGNTFTNENLMLKEMTVDLDEFSSTSSMELMLRRTNIDVPSAKIKYYINSKAKEEPLHILKSILKKETCYKSEKKENQCICVNIAVLEPNRIYIEENGLLTVKLSSLDIKLLCELKKKRIKPLRDFIFVLHTDDKEYTLCTVSKEISLILEEEHKDIFKLVFDSKDKGIIERIEACMIQKLVFWTNKLIENGQLSEETIATLQKGTEKRKDVLQVHQFKTVALRNEFVSGFGYVFAEKKICVYLKRNNSTEQSKVREYLHKICGPPDGYKLVIEHQARKFKMFTRLEQGSKIQKNRTCPQSTKPVPDKQHRKTEYGSIGMFLKDDKDTYFLTTCAHVIGKGHIAYSSTDSSRLGHSILTHHSGREELDGPWMDFSLVKISPENEIICQLGLKTTSHNRFIKGRIFRGDVFNVSGEMVYKWGATEPHLREAKCTKVDHDQEREMFIIEVDNENFAVEGDSGSIVCVGDSQESGEAVFVLVGRVNYYKTNDEGNDEAAAEERRKSSYLVYKVQDALDKVATFKASITPCLSPRMCTIPISQQ